jgi:hypothetical protein
MKYVTILVTTVCLLAACKSKQQQDAEKLMEQIQTTVKANSPGTIATSENGYYMKAKIDGKEWIASAMFPVDNSDSRRIQGENNGEMIGFYCWMRGLEPGKKIEFSEDHAADLYTNDDVGIWGGRKGEITITKIDDQVLEGQFHFTASTSRSTKTLEVTDGIFRVPRTPPAK